MKMLLAVLCLSCVLTHVVCQTSLTAADQQEILNEHNRLRGMVNPTAANMERMIWSDELAQVAQNYAKQCNFAHNGARTTQQATFSYVGENLAAGSGAANYVGFVQSWYNEVKHFNYGSNSCNPNKACGHYTQVVWATSSSLGCGAFRCTQLQGISGGGANWVIFVCNYGPGGNFRGRKPYISGTVCSQCPQNKPSCSSNLCQTSSIISASATTTANVMTSATTVANAMTSATTAIVDNAMTSATTATVDNAMTSATTATVDNAMTSTTTATVANAMTSATAASATTATVDNAMTSTTTATVANAMTSATAASATTATVDNAMTSAAVGNTDASSSAEEGNTGSVGFTGATGAAGSAISSNQLTLLMVILAAIMK